MNELMLIIAYIGAVGSTFFAVQKRDALGAAAAVAGALSVVILAH